MTDESNEARWNAPTVAVDPADAPRTKIGTSVFDHVGARFDELTELGRGGMGRVVEAVDTVLGRTVAIKHSLAADEIQLVRFEREVRITSRLQHPGIVPILDTGRDVDGRPFYVMRKIDGEPLASRVAACATVADRIALVPAMLAAVDAAGYAHANGVVHRDIKPWNILLGPFGEALLIDWGLARELGGEPDAPGEATASGDGLTRAGSAYGTPGFMAPEQARGEQADRRADVYSIGATLYYILAGASPFAGVPPAELVDRVAAGGSPDLADIPDAVPAALVAIAGKALAADRDARYADAGELAADLRRFFAGQLVAAHRYTTRERIARWVARHKVAAMIGAIAAAVIAVGGVVSVRRIVAERDDAREARGLAEARAEDMLVDRARLLVGVDPTSAIAALRDLPPSSARWPVAREIARAAVTGGVDRRIAKLDRSITALALWSNGRLASATVAAIQLHDRGTTRTLLDRGATTLAWLDDRTLVRTYRNSGAEGEVDLIDAETGKVTQLATDHRAVATALGKVYVLGTDGSLRAIAPDGTSVQIATGVEAIDARGERFVAASQEHLVVIDRDGSRSYDLSLPSRLFSIRISPSGELVGALYFRGTAAWSLADPATTKRWPRSTDALNGIEVGGETLYGWSNDGSGVVAFDGDVAASRWLVRPDPFEGLLAGRTPDGTFLATPTGALALAGPLGLLELPRRRLRLTALAAGGGRLVAGTRDGDVIEIDLASALPRVIPAGPGTQLYTVGGGRALIGREAGTYVAGDDPATATATDELAIVDPISGERHALPPLGGGTHAWSVGRSIVAVAQSGTLAIWDLDGHPRYRVGDIIHVTVGTGLDGDAAFTYERSGDIREIPIADPDHARVLAHHDLKVIDGSRVPSVFGLAPTRCGLLFNLELKTTMLVDRSGERTVDFGLARPPTSAICTSDGTWWLVEDHERLWRVPPGGTKIEVKLDQHTRWVANDGDRVLALGETTVYEVALDGHVVGGSEVGQAKALAGGIVTATPKGVETIALAADVRRTLRLPTAPSAVFASQDGRTIAARIALPDRSVAIAMWLDPVPADPFDVPAYLAGFTNARLAPGSQLVTWDAR